MMDAVNLLERRKKENEAKKLGLLSRSQRLIEIKKLKEAAQKEQNESG